MKLSVKEITLILILVSILVFYLLIVLLFLPQRTAFKELTQKLEDVNTEKVTIDLRLGSESAYRDRADAAAREIAEYEKLYMEHFTAPELDRYIYNIFAECDLEITTLNMGYNETLTKTNGYVVTLVFQGTEADYHKLCGIIDSGSGFLRIQSSSYNKDGCMMVIHVYEKI